MIITFDLLRFLDIQNIPSPELSIPDCPSALHTVTNLHKNIPIPTFSPVSSKVVIAESIDFSQTSKSSASIASMLHDEEPHSLQAADIQQLLN